VWVGNAPKSELVEQCIKSWKEFLPDCEIIEWNNDSLHSIDCKYVHQAFKAPKWAFVSDYLRLYALYHHGGFYFDSDLEITANIEEFRKHSFVTGFEIHKGRLSPITAFMGSEANNSLMKELLDEYKNLAFIKEDGSYDMVTNTARITEQLISKGLVKLPLIDHLIDLPDDGCIYPSHYFCTPKVGLPNFSIHHFGGSWREKIRRRLTLTILKFRFVFIKRKFELKLTDFSIPLKRDERVIAFFLFYKYGFLFLKLK